MELSFADKFKITEELLKFLHEQNKELRETIYKLKTAEKAVGSLISTVYNLKQAYKDLEILEKESGEEPVA